MKTSLRPLLMAALLLLGGAGTLHAQLSKIFVASSGNDANDGSRGSPKRNFQAAHDAVAAGGQIVVLDTAGYGALNITKSLAVTVPPGVNGFVTVSGDNSGITINAGASVVVALRGLIVEGGGSDANGRGIQANSVGDLAIEECTVRSFFFGILATAMNLYVHHCTVRGCSYGLAVENGANNVPVLAVATGCRLEQNSSDGVLALANNGSGGSVDLTLADCVSAGNDFGIESDFPGAVVRVDNCRVTSNRRGLVAAFGGQILSRGNNTVEHNTNADIGTIGIYSAK